MLSVYMSGQKYPITEQSNFYITHVDGGEDTLDFDIQTDTQTYKRLAEESRIEYGDNYYVVKSIDAPSRLASISCVVDLDFLRGDFHRVYDSGSVTLRALLQTLLPAGWTIEGYDPEISRTIHMENATNYDIANQAMSTYSVAYEWHTKAKRLVIINPNNVTPSGEYLTDELNLRSIAYKGKSKDLITRLYPYGKDGLTIASVNGGVEYLENHQYTDKVICGYWSDDRYTVPANLKADAEDKLKQLSAPARSYECDVIDLAKLNDKYKDFQFSMYKVVTLIDRQRHVRMNHQVMEYREYPDHPEKNIITLSSVVKGITTQVSQAISDVQDTVNEQRSVQQQFSDLMANALGYYHTEQQDEQGRTTTYIHDKPLLSDSSTIWKISIDGFAVSMDGGQSWSGGFTAATNLVAQIISTNRINSISNPNVYFDLVNGVIASSKLVASDNSQIHADVGTEEPQYGSAKGLFLYYGIGNDTKFAQIYRVPDDDSSRHDGAQLLSLGDLSILSDGGIAGGAANRLNMFKDANGKGGISITRAHDTTASDVLYADDSDTEIYSPAQKGEVSVSDSSIEFKTDGSSRGSIDSNGWNGWVNGPLYGTRGITETVTLEDGMTVHGTTLHFENGLYVGHSNQT
jgi:phage minor structural protein